MESRRRSFLRKILSRTVASVLSACLLFAGLALVSRPAMAANFTEIVVPTAGSGALDVALGPDGNMWFTEYSANKIGVASVTGTVLHEYIVPTPASGPSCMVQGPDGNMWFTEFQANKIGRITTAGVITEYNVPGVSGPWGLCVGPDGNLWFTESISAELGRCTTTGVITEFPLTGVTAPRGITRGPDGNLWLVGQGSNNVARVTTAGAVTSYPIPTVGSQPFGICMGPDGNLWFTEYAGNKIGMCTAAGAFTEYPIATAGSNPIGIEPGPDGNLWFCEQAGNKIGKCTTLGTILEYTVPTANCRPVLLANAPDGSIWFGETNASKIGRAEAFETSNWYLAEGSTAWGFNTYISLENPNGGVVHASVTYMPTGSAPVNQVIALPAGSQTTITNDELVTAMGGQRDFSTRVVCQEGASIAVERTMSWTGPGAASPEAHSSVGVLAPARHWFLAEGSTAWGFECWLLIQNPTAYAANCQITYMIEGEGPQVVNKTVPPNSRQSFNMAADIGAKDASIEVASNVPVIPERAMYRYDRREGHESIGTPAPALKYYLAEGTTAWGFTTYVLVQNPNDSPCDVTVTYQTATGPTAMPVFTMPANSRKTIRVNDVMPNVDLSTTVEGTLPIIAERAMYLGTPSGEISHDSIGFSATHRVFFLPDGQTTAGRETFTLVQNPNAVAVDVALVYLMDGGTGNSTHIYTIPANSRQTFPMYYGASGRGSVLVVCTTGQDIMVEHAMYWNGRQVATGTIGGYMD